MAWMTLGTCQSLVGKKEVTWMTLGTSHFLDKCIGRIKHWHGGPLGHARVFREKEGDLDDHWDKSLSK